MRKMKKINGFLVVRFNDREKRDYPQLGNFGVIDAESYTGDIDIDRGAMEYDDADTIEVAVEQARGLDAEQDYSDEPPVYTVTVETAEGSSEEEVFPQLLIDGWERKLSTQVKSKHYPDTDPRTAAHELYGFKVALHRLGLISESDTTVDPDHFAPGMIEQPLPREPEELLAYVCDKVCKHLDKCTGQDELDSACAKCSVGRLASDAKDRDLRIMDAAKKRLDGLIQELSETQLNTKAERLEHEVRAYLEAISTTKAFSEHGVAVYEIAISEAVKTRPSPMGKSTFENLGPETRDSIMTENIYALGELLEDDCPDNDCRIYLNIFRMAKEVDTLLDELDPSGHPAHVLQRDLRRGLSELKRMYLENYAVKQYKEGVKA